MNTTGHPLESRLQDASTDLRKWWHANSGIDFLAGEEERSSLLRSNAQEILRHTYLHIDRISQKIQLTAGEKAVQLFNFESEPRGVMKIRSVDEGDTLQPGQTMDLAHFRSGISNELAHGSLTAVYMGHVYQTHSIAMAETLALGGKLQLVPGTAEDTHWQAYLERRRSSQNTSA